MSESDELALVMHRHTCQCSHHGKVVQTWLPIVDGAVDFPRPMCAETGAELRQVSFTTHPRPKTATV